MARFRWPGFCNHWWPGTYMSETVEHECILKPGHEGDHLCGCADVKEASAS